MPSCSHLIQKPYTDDLLSLQVMHVMCSFPHFVFFIKNHILKELVVLTGQNSKTTTQDVRDGIYSPLEFCSDHKSQHSKTCTECNVICSSRVNVTSELKAQYHFLNDSNLQQLLAFSMMNSYQVKQLSDSNLACNV